MKLVPGAKEFIQSIIRKGVLPVYLSNRGKYRLKETSATMERLGLGKAEALNEVLYLREDSIDKEPRRQTIEKKYDVLLWVGDNLSDFNKTFGKTGEKTVFELMPSG